ncbi:MAG: hypothetical protein LBT13_02195 [Treponema sp.]|nr:hypothetical protein [Treponema sp.]
MRSGKPRQTTNLLTTVFLTMVLLVSCASQAKVKPGIQDAGFASLARGALVYLYVDVQGGRSILDRLTFEGSAQVAQVLDRTESAVVAFYPGGAPRRFLTVAQGRYPSSQAAWSFTLSPSWKKRRSETGAAYWHSTKGGISVFLGPDQARVSDGDPFVLPPGVEVPEGFEEFQQGAVMAGWMEDAQELLNNIVASLGIPLQLPATQILFSLYGSGNEYETNIRIETPSVSHARAFMILLSQVQRALVNGNSPEAIGDPLSLIAALLANPPVQDGPYLKLHTGSLDAKGIALLFNRFSLYSN